MIHMLITLLLPTAGRATVAGYNPVTYLLEALRSLMTVGWDGAALGKGFLAVLGVGTVSITLALAALRGRASRRWGP